MNAMKRISALLLVLCTLLAFAACDRNNDPEGKKPEATLEYVNYVLATAPTKVTTEVKTTLPDLDCITLTSTSVLQVREDAAGKYSKYTYNNEQFAGVGSENLTEFVSGTVYTRGNTYRNEEGKDVLYRPENGITFASFALPASTSVAEVGENAYFATVSFGAAQSKAILGYELQAQGNITLTMAINGGKLTAASLQYTTVSGATVVANCSYDYTVQSFK